MSRQNEKRKRRADRKRRERKRSTRQLRPKPYLLLSGRKNGGRWRAELVHATEAVRKVGEPTMAAIAACLYGMDRVRTLTQAMQWALKASARAEAEAPEPLVEGDTEVGVRVWMFFALLLPSELYEFSKAVGVLGGTKIHEKLSDPRHWFRLNDLAKRWRTDMGRQGNPDTGRPSPRRPRDVPEGPGLRA